MRLYYFFFTLIILVKISFLLSALSLRYYKFTKPDDKKKIKDFTCTKERLELVYKLMMAVLLIYLFNSRFSGYHTHLDKETKFMLSLFGTVLIVTGDYAEFQCFRKIDEK